MVRTTDADYRLPTLGEWDGPIYGELGVLEEGPDGLVCHIGGRAVG